MGEKKKRPTLEEIQEQITPEGRERYGNMAEKLDEETARTMLEEINEMVEGLERAGRVRPDTLRLQFSE